MRRWLNLTSKFALLLGIGAVSATTAPIGAIGASPERVPQESVKTFGALTMWLDGGRIYVAERGREARELALGDIPATRRLRELLERDGATAQSPRTLDDRIILVGGGGDAFHWEPQKPPKSHTNQAAGRVRSKTTPPLTAKNPPDDPAATPQAYTDPNGE